jgi:hypothetical protein
LGPSVSVEVERIVTVIVIVAARRTSISAWKRPRIRMAIRVRARRRRHRPFRHRRHPPMKMKFLRLRKRKRNGPDADYSKEDPFESVDINELSSLPEGNDPKYPQENPQYFRRKNYVRKDKYELSWFFAEHEEDIAVEIPQLLDMFSKAK